VVPEAMAPFGQALSAFFQGDRETLNVVSRDDGYGHRLPISVFFPLEVESSTLESNRRGRNCLGETRLQFEFGSQKGFFAAGCTSICKLSRKTLPERGGV